MSFTKSHRIPIMSNHVRIRLKPDATDDQINSINSRLSASHRFLTNQDLEDWVEDINTNPESPQKHLKPITIQELKKVMPTWTTPGEIDVDISFSRTSQDEAADRYCAQKRTSFAQHFK